MAETYCGKTCVGCAQKEILACAGCKVGPGRQHDGDCKLAKCCREKGHQECITCGHNGTCNTLRGKERMLEYRLKAIEAEKIRAAAIAKCAPVLGRWLWILFWLIIPNTIASFMTDETIVGLIPAALVLGQVLGAICSSVYGIILIRLASEEERYRTAGICALVCGVMNLLTACIPGAYQDSWWVLTLALLTVIAVPIGQYNEFTAHSVVLTGLDNKQAEKWAALWKWYIMMYGAIIGSVLLILFIPFLGFLVTFAAGIGRLVVSIFKLVYLYRTAKLFREYSIEGN